MLRLFKKKKPSEPRDLSPSSPANALVDDKIEQEDNPQTISTEIPDEGISVTTSPASSEHPLSPVNSYEDSIQNNDKVVVEGDTQQDTLETTKQGFFSRLKQSLHRTRSNLSQGLGRLVLGKKQIDEDLLEEIETQLLLADVGVEATDDIISELTQRVTRKELKDPQALIEHLKSLLCNLLQACEQPLVLDTTVQPNVILMVGINGAGKTTTIGKLAKRYQQQGQKVMLAAGDTFRAAAVEQLQVWGERNNIAVIAQRDGADSASVVFDALSAAKARQVDILIADTAGRLHTQAHLMEELKKIKRVMGKQDPSAPHEVMLVLDAGIGQNALNQAREFNDKIGVTGLAITKLDGTAKGGILFAIAKEMRLPIRYIGVGEKIDDLRPFEAQVFVDALFDQMVEE